MNLENEYFTLKQELKIEEEKLAKFENTKIVEDENNPFTNIKSLLCIHQISYNFVNYTLIRQRSL